MNTVVVGRGKGCPGPAALDEGGQLGFISRSKTVDELRQLPAIVPHRKSSVRQWFCATASAISLHHHFKRLLLEMTNVNLTLFAKNNSLDAVTGDVITADLDLGDQIALEPEVQKSIIEVLHASGELMAVEARANGKRFRGGAPGQPKNLIDVVYRHIG